MTERQTNLPRLRTTPLIGTRSSLGAPAPFGVAESVELLVDLLGATGLVAADKLALARGRARQTGSLAGALVDEGIATSEGVARHHAVQTVPLHVLERVVAIPYELDGGVLRIAVADPANVQAIDELRLATSYQLDLGVASRDDILGELGRLARVSSASALAPTIEDVPELGFDEDFAPETDLEADDGVSEAPLVRLVNSILFQAAEDGASDVHFEPQEDALLVRFRIDGV